MKHKFKREILYGRKGNFIIIFIATIAMCLFIPLYAIADTVSSNDIFASDDNESNVSDNDIEDIENSSEVSNNDNDTSNNDSNSINFSDNTTVVNDKVTVSDNDTTVEDSETDGDDQSEPAEDDSDPEHDFKIYKTQLNAQLMDNKLKYLDSVEAEWAERLAIEEKKLELGYSTSVEVEEARIQHTSIQMQKEDTDELKTFYEDCIVLYGGKYEEISVSEEWIALSEDYLSKFKENDSQIKIYQEQIDFYQERIESVGAGTEAALAYEKLLQTIKDNLAQYEADLEIYVRQFQIQYNSLGRKFTDVNNQIGLLQTKIKNAQLLLEKGKITKVEIMGLRNEVSGLEYERISYQYDALKIKYILDNTIQNQTI